MHLNASSWGFHLLLMNFYSIIMLPGGIDLTYNVAGCAKKNFQIRVRNASSRIIQEWEETG